VAKWTAPIRVIAVVLLLFLFAGAGATALFSGSTSSGTPSSFSPLSLNVMTVLCLVEGAIACAYSLVRRIRRRKGNGPLVLSSPQLPVPPAHS
jgi:hypothetical protein